MHTQPLLFKTLLGQTIYIIAEQGDTWLTLKHKILEKAGYSIESQRIVVEGRLVNDDTVVALDEICQVAFIHLLVPSKPKFDLVSHNLEQLTAANRSSEAKTKIIAIDHGGTLERSLPDNAGQPITAPEKDLVLTINKQNITTVMPNGKEVLPMLEKITAENKDCLLASHSKNDLATQVEFFRQIREAYKPNNPPHFSLIPVYDRQNYPTTSSENPRFFYLDKSFNEIAKLPDGANIADYSIVIAWGADDLDGKVSVRKALEKGVEHYGMLNSIAGNLDKTNSWILDDGETIASQAKKEGWNSCLICEPGIGAPEGSISLLDAITTIKKTLSKDNAQTQIEPPQQDATLPLISKTSLQQVESQFRLNLAKFHNLAEELQETAKTNHDYNAVASQANQLYCRLLSETDSFFENPAAGQFKQFAENCTKIIEDNSDQFKNHRGWHKIDPVLRGFLGLIAAITILPGLIVALACPHGYLGTFFSVPKTNSQCKLEGLTDELNNQIKAVGAACA